MKLNVHLKVIKLMSLQINRDRVILIFLNYCNLTFSNTC